MTDITVCEHVSGPESMVSMCRMPDKGERSAHCPCCGIAAVVSEHDDLTDPPMLCPYCSVAAVLGEPTPRIDVEDHTNDSQFDFESRFSPIWEGE